MAILAAITAASAAIGAGASIYGTATRDQSGPARQQQIANAQIDDARRNDLYQQLVSAMINQRSVAGTQDSFGSTSRYDPGSNTWISQLGDLPQAADTSAMQATIRQNTTQARLAELANEQAAIRAARGGPAADAAQRELSDFRPMDRSQLVGLLTKQGTTAASEAYTPMVNDMLRTYARTGVDAGPSLSVLGRTQADTLRKTLTDAQISGMENVDSVNESKRRGLENAATTATAFANPTFQSSTVAPSANAKNLADTLANRIYSSTVAPAYGAGGVNTANKNSADAYAAASKAAGIVPSQPGAEIGKQLADLGGNKNFTDALKTLFGSNSPGTGNMNTTALNSAEQNYYDTYTAGKPYTQPEF